MTGAASGRCRIYMCLCKATIALTLQPGIGQQTALSFIVEGCRKIAIADRNAEGLSKTIELIRTAAAPAMVSIVSHTVDVSQEEQIQTFIDQVVAELGRIDYAVNAAGEPDSHLNVQTLSQILKLSRYSQQQRKVSRDQYCCLRPDHKRQLPRLLAFVQSRNQTDAQTRTYSDP